MKFFADFHIHSHYSIATSKNLTLENLEKWAIIKGIRVVGTGDMIHPGWYAELKEKLIPSDDGLYMLKSEYRLDEVKALYDHTQHVKFMLTGEISTIYKKNGKTRKVHNLIMTSSFTTLEKIQGRLDSLGNIRSDGRPILGMSSRDLLEIVLESGDDAFLVPAHIWTPWFSVLGSKSGYDRIEQCFDDLSPYIFALETGLSSDPPMNWICSSLDRYTLISNSDAHSPEKLGREANIFDTEISYQGIMDSIKGGNKGSFLGTIEFFPEEGKYHLDGHRKCGIRWAPHETAKHKSICPVCKKKVTVGVLHRVNEIADRTNPKLAPNAPPFYSLTSLKSILSEIMGVGPSSKKVNHYYRSLIRRGGSEFSLLLDLPFNRVRDIGGEILAEGIRRLRNRKVYIAGGFDGEFGKITVFEPEEIHSFSRQISLLEDETKRPSPPKRKSAFESLIDESRLEEKDGVSIRKEPDFDGSMSKKCVNVEQEEAINHFLGPGLIIAGPGTGKTYTLTRRIIRLIQDKGIDPLEILAVTFTRKAAQEMEKRINQHLPHGSICRPLSISTFHSLGLMILREHAAILQRSTEFSIFTEDEKDFVLRKYLNIDTRDVKRTRDEIRDAKNRGLTFEDVEDRTFSRIYQEYEMILKRENAFDIDDLILGPFRLLKIYPSITKFYTDKYRFICIDEYQDINLIQYMLIRLLAPEKDANICVIGDPNQAIYSFRGADVRFINNFKEDYPSARIYQLKTSYRCSDTILQASTQVVGCKEDRILIDGLNNGVAISVQEFPTAKSEAEFVARTIEKMMGGTRFFSLDSQITDGDLDDQITSFSDFAVLFRIAKIAPDLEKAMNDHGIPFQTVGEEPFFRKEPIASIIDILRLITFPENDILFEKLKEKKINGITESWRADRGTTGVPYKVSEQIAEVVKTHFHETIRPDSQRVERLLTLAQMYEDDLPGLLSFTQLGIASDTYDPKNERVSLMTLHAAKGLEFPCVFIVGCEEGIIPFSLFKEFNTDPQEERRLFYVGMTRAKQVLYLTYARRRTLYGRSLGLPLCPFVANIEEELLKREKQGQNRGKKEKDDKQLSLF
ncbi:MAG: UvrD-helicase domain-containing protein [Thermodesulfobacteriota bacterium]|nr:UvrD-helicase domain-containing protein [Thermodesulfobacteriota bacterium]